jgi:hypothetical protein
VADLVEDMGVDVERRAHLSVPEDAADLGDVQTEIEDQVTREGVPEIVLGTDRQGGERIGGRSA